MEAIFWVTSMIYIIGYILANHHFALKLSVAHSLLTMALGMIRLWGQDTFLLLEPSASANAGAGNFLPDVHPGQS